MYFATDLVYKDTIEYYLASNSQVTIKEIADTYLNILNEKGLQVYQMVMSEISKLEECGTPKIVQNYKLMAQRSGMWSRDSKDYKPKGVEKYVDDNINIIITTTNNLNVQGLFMNKPINTSTLLMYGSLTSKKYPKVDKWAYTSSGSIYFLQPADKQIRILHVKDVENTMQRLQWARMEVKVESEELKMLSVRVTEDDLKKIETSMEYFGITCVEEDGEFTFG